MTQREDWDSLQGCQGQQTKKRSRERESTAPAQHSTGTGTEQSTDIQCQSCPHPSQPPSSLSITFTNAPIDTDIWYTQCIENSSSNVLPVQFLHILDHHFWVQPDTQSYFGRKLLGGQWRVKRTHTKTKITFLIE